MPLCVITETSASSSSQGGNVLKCFAKHDVCFVNPFSACHDLFQHAQAPLTPLELGMQQLSPEPNSCSTLLPASDSHRLLL